MFLRAGAVSLALLLASRLLGVVRESAQAAAFGRSGMADIAVLLLTLPDLLVSIAATGALAYVLLPAWAGQPAAAVAALQRRVAWRGALAAAAVGVLLAAAHEPVLHALAGGLPPGWRPAGAQALLWAAAALPFALVAALWSTRLQHERDFLGMYGANLVVNVLLIAGLLVAARVATTAAVLALGTALLLAMGARLAWLRLRMPAVAPSREPVHVAMPPAHLWTWAVLAAALPLLLPFTARSAASQAGEGALAVFNYAWKLVELPLLLAIQLVASLSFPAVARALAADAPREKAAAPIRLAFGLAWALACAAVSGLAWAAPALARILFGWGRMPEDALVHVAQWGIAGSWGLLPQAVSAVALTVLAARRQLRAPVLAYAAAFALLVVAALAGVRDGSTLMLLLNAGFLGVALACVLALGRDAREWLPTRAFGWSALAMFATAAPGYALQPATLPALAGLGAGALAAATVLAFALWRAPELRQGLRR